MLTVPSTFQSSLKENSSKIFKKVKFGLLRPRTRRLKDFVTYRMLQNRNQQLFCQQKHAIKKVDFFQKSCHLNLVRVLWSISWPDQLLERWNKLFNLPVGLYRLQLILNNAEKRDSGERAMLQFWSGHIKKLGYFRIRTNFSLKLQL